MTETRRRVFREGLIAGVLGYLAVVALFAVADITSGEGLLHTPQMLGSALLGDVLDPGSAAPILAYNGLHLLVSLALGLGASFLAGRAEDDHDLGSGLVFFVLAIGGFVPIFFGAVTVEYLQAMGWAEVIAGSALGAIATLGYIALSHRALVQALFDEAKA